MAASTTTLFTVTLFCSLYVWTDTALAHAETDIEGVPINDSEITDFGSYDPDVHAGRTIRIRMDDDMTFTPDEIHVTQGEVVRIVPANGGKLIHEFVLGTEASLSEHARLTEEFPNLEHDNPWLIHVDPGEVGGITWRFTTKGKVMFGCLIPGHYDAGMKGVVFVK